MRGLLSVSTVIDAVLAFIARMSGLCFLLMVLVICFDVITRKFGFQLFLLNTDVGSTRLQEMEWHLHAIVFLTWIGHCYVRNAHVRIDVFTSGLSERSKSWLELFGCMVFALPYVLVALPHAWDFFTQSYGQNESSAAPNGLPYRWIVKGFLFYVFASILAAVISVFIRRVVFLFGSPDLARQAMPDVQQAAH